MRLKNFHHLIKRQTGGIGCVMVAVDISLFEMPRHEVAMEEEVLFPHVKTLVHSAAAVPAPFGSVRNPIQVMEHEHDSAGAALARMRELIGDYEPPMDACNTFRASLDGLAELERDTHQHVHKENNVLFPRALEREVALQFPARG